MAACLSCNCLLQSKAPREDSGPDFLLGCNLKWLYANRCTKLNDSRQKYPLPLCLAWLTDKQAFLTGATRSSNKSCLCLLICQSSRIKLTSQVWHAEFRSCSLLASLILLHSSTWCTGKILGCMQSKIQIVGQAALLYLVEGDSQLIAYIYIILAYHVLLNERVCMFNGKCEFSLSPIRVNSSFLSFMNHWKWGLKFNSAQWGPCPVKYWMLSSSPERNQMNTEKLLL